MAKEKNAKSANKAKNISELVTSLIKDVVEECGCKLWDVEFVKEGADYSLIVSIDKEGGVSLEDCEMVNDAVNPIIDEADPIEGSYFLEISSAGLERELTKPEHIKAYIGSRVSVKLYAPLENDGRKQFESVLLSYDEEGKKITIDDGDGKELCLEFSKVALLKNIAEF